MPVQLDAMLEEFGIKADSALARGWNTLSNGDLVRAAVQHKFTVLLTRDRLFGESAASALMYMPSFVWYGLRCHSFVRCSFCNYSAQHGRLPRSFQHQDG